MTTFSWRSAHLALLPRAPSRSGFIQGKLRDHHHLLEVIIVMVVMMMMMVTMIRIMIIILTMNLTMIRIKWKKTYLSSAERNTYIRSMVMMIIMIKMIMMIMIMMMIMMIERETCQREFGREEHISGRWTQPELFSERNFKILSVLFHQLNLKSAISDEIVFSPKCFGQRSKKGFCTKKRYLRWM